jgi:hypothetical protein
MPVALMIRIIAKRCGFARSSAADFEDRYKEANDLIGAKMMAQPIKQMPYEPVGISNWSFDHLEVRMTDGN